MPNHHSPLRVLFLLQRPEAWPNVASVWREMKERPGFDPEILLLPYNIKLKNELKFNQHKDLLKKHGVPFVEWKPTLVIQPNQFDVVIFTHPYDRERPEQFSFRNIAKVINRIVYIPYGLSVGSGYQNLSYQYSQPLQVGASLIVARSNADKKMYERYCPSGDSSVKVLGHPRFDYLVRSLQGVSCPRMKAFIDGRIAVLWNSHFSFTKKYSERLCFSSFDNLGPDIFRFFISNRNIFCLIWRPHPLLFLELIQDKILTKDEIKILEIELEDLGIFLDQGADHTISFRYSDAMLSDPGSFWFEYLATKKPFLPLLPKNGEPLNHEAKCLISSCGGSAEFLNVKNFLINLSKNNINLDIFRDLQHKHIPYLDGRSGERLCLELLGLPIQFSRMPEKNIIGKFSKVNANIIANEFTNVDAGNNPILYKLILYLERLNEIKSKESAILKLIRRKRNKIQFKINAMLRCISQFIK